MNEWMNEWMKYFTANKRFTENATRRLPEKEITIKTGRLFLDYSISINFRQIYRNMGNQTGRR